MRKALGILLAALSLQACVQTPSPQTQQQLDKLSNQLAEVDKRQQQVLDTLAKQQPLSRADIEAAQQPQKALLASIKAKLVKKTKPVVCPPSPRMQCPEATPMPVKDDKLIVGALEKVRLHPSDVVLTARIDTGATSASLDARDIKPFERDGEDWVRFKVPTDDKGNHYMTVERKVLRWVRILQSVSEEGERRPVVEFRFDIGPISQRAEFNLSDRSHLEYPVLIGRNILRDVMVVDVGKEYSLKLPKLTDENSKK
ncbi:ATP-dependent zinc protease [Gallaecimonas sp. GXIMD1310]|uniref:ATP-dependent zinc protease family protein n=1 Tax=Gallaecimonas sp. GXIMD1310 TaxID=3131926 RepID=UPI003248F528